MTSEELDELMDVVSILSPLSRGATLETLPWTGGVPTSNGVYLFRVVDRPGAYVATVEDGRVTEQGRIPQRSWPLSDYGGHVEHYLVAE